MPLTRANYRNPSWLIRNRGWLWLLAIWAFAFAMRAIFVSDVLAHCSTRQIHDFHFDSREYVHLAQNLANTGEYEIDTPESHFFALLRTPGYPAFCAIFFNLGWGFAGIFWAQAFLSSLIPPMVFLLARAVFKDMNFAVLAGLAASISTTGIGLSAILLADLLFAVALLAGFNFLVAGAASNRRWGWLGAGFIFAIAILIKPAILYFSPIIAIAWWRLSRANDRPMRWGALAWVIALPILAMALWSARNHAHTKHWVYSTVDAQNLRHFIAPQAEECAKAAGLPEADAVYANHRAAMTRDLADVLESRISPADLARRQRTEALAVIEKNPGWTLLGLISSSFTCLHDAWAWTPSQLTTPSAFRESIYFLNAWQIDLRLPILGLGLLIAFEYFLMGRRKHASPALRGEIGAMSACALVLLYFFAISGTSFSTGFRIIYPAEFTIILLGLGGIRSAMRMLAAYTRAARARAESAALTPDA